MSADIGSLARLQQEPMKIGQMCVVAICVGIMALDGYDVLSIAFAAPGITAQWGISKATLGIILSLELVGMAFGSMLLGTLADARGRRPTLLLGLIILTIGMLAAGLAPTVFVLGVARVFTGIGIGGLIAAAPTTSSDYSNNKNRAFVAVLVTGGFAFGIYLGATFLAPLLRQYDWRVTFYLGAILSFIFIPLVYFFVPETISYLERKRPQGALEKIQRIMQSLGHSVPDELLPREEKPVEPEGFNGLFNSGLALTTCILAFAYFGNIGTYYYFVKWLPTIVSDIGYSASEATKVLGVVSLGGVIGSIGMSVAARFISIRPLMVVCLVFAALGVGLFPYFTESLDSMKQVGFLVGALIFAAISGFVGLFATYYPSSILGSGSGFILGVGRGGAMLGPMIPGFLFAIGLSLQEVAVTMAAGSLFAGVAILFLRSTKKN